MPPRASVSFFHRDTQASGDSDLFLRAMESWSEGPGLQKRAGLAQCPGERGERLVPRFSPHTSAEEALHWWGQRPAGVRVRQAGLANSLDTGPTHLPPTQDSHTAAPQEVAGLYFSQHWVVKDILSIKKQTNKQNTCPSADNTSLRTWPTYW